MGIIGSTIKPFKATAFQAGKDFFDVTDAGHRRQVGGVLLLSGRLHIRLPDRAGRSRRTLRHAAEARRRSLRRLHRHAFQPQGLARHLGQDRQDQISRSSATRTTMLANNFGVLREGVGLADRATFVVDPDGVIQIMEITCEGVGRNANELVRKIKAAQYVRAQPRSRSARRSGKKAATRWLLRSTSSARSNHPSAARFSGTHRAARGRAPPPRSRFLSFTRPDFSGTEPCSTPI